MEAPKLPSDWVGEVASGAGRFMGSESRGDEGAHAAAAGTSKKRSDVRRTTLRQSVRKIHTWRHEF